MSKLVDMELEEAFVYLEEKYDWYSARYMYEDSAYYKGTSEELETTTFIFYRLLTVYIKQAQYTLTS